MKLARFVVNHSARHRDGVLEDFIGETDLLQRVNATGRQSEIDRPSADDVAFTRIGAALGELDIVSPPSEICAEQPAGQAASDEDKFRRHSSEFLTTDCADITD